MDNFANNLRLANDVSCPHDWLVRMSYAGKIDCHKQFSLALLPAFYYYYSSVINLYF